MSVKAKFRIESVTKTKGWQEKHPFVYEVKAQPVTGGSPDNDAFYASTPYGQLSMGGVSEQVANQLEPGKEYYLTIEPA